MAVSLVFFLHNVLAGARKSSSEILPLDVTWLSREAPVATLNVSWASIPQQRRKPGDWIGIYSPHDAPPTAALDWFPVESAPWETTMLQLPGLRDTYGVRYFSPDSNTKWIAESVPLALKMDGCTPSMTRLSLTGQEGEVRLLWTSNVNWPPVVLVKPWESYTGKDELEPFGFEPGRIHFRSHSLAQNGSFFIGSASSYDAKDMCYQPATFVASNYFRSPGWTHDVLLTDLEPEKEYRVRYGHGSCWRVTKIRGPQRIAPESEFSILLFGDQGPPSSTPDLEVKKAWHYPGSRHVMSELGTRARHGHVKMTQIIGDLAYSFGQSYKWDWWLQHGEQFMQKVPTMVTVGNHEYLHPSLQSPRDPSGVKVSFSPSWGNYRQEGLASGGECGVPFTKRFHMPETGNGNFWYSYDVGSLHVVSISTEHNFTSGSKQYLWLVNDLRKVDHGKTPWIIVMMHRPAYMSEDYRADTDVAYHLRKHLDPIWTKFAVNMVVSGHYHAYTRTCPVAEGLCRGTLDNPRAPVQLTAGSGGIGLDTVRCRPFKWSEKCFAAYGFVQVFVSSSDLRVQFWGMNWEDPPSTQPDGHEQLSNFEVLDEFVLKPYHPASSAASSAASSDEFVPYHPASSAAKLRGGGNLSPDDVVL